MRDDRNVFNRGNGTVVIVGSLVAGVDEVGRGPLAGPVVAAAVILDPARPIAGLRDSKALTPVRRETLAAQIRAQALAWSIAEAGVEEIDEINILNASLLAMKRAVESLARAPTLALVDGNRLPDLDCEARAVVGGDRSEAAISAASIVAKVYRDELMVGLHVLYPEFGFDGHKGYPTRQHLEALRRIGASPVHRRSFRPVREAIRSRVQTEVDAR